MGPLAVLLPVIALVAAILPSSAMAQLSGTSFSGYVYSSNSGQPLSGITVTLLDATTSSSGPSTTTDSNGNFSFSGLTSGDDYYVSYSFPGTTTEYYDENANNDVTTSQSTAATDAGNGSDTLLDSFGFAPAGISIPGLNATSISGNVYSNDTDEPMSGVTVTAIDATTPANGGQTATTDANGSYTLSGLVSGDYYYVSYAAAGYLTQYYDENGYYGLTASTAQASADALAGNDSELDSGTAYTAFLISGGAVDGTLSFPNGTSPSGYVQVYTPGGGSSYSYVEADGSYSVLGVTGSHNVVEYDPNSSALDYVWYGGSSGAPSFSQNLAAPVAVTSGQVTSGVNFSVPATAKVTGTVSGPSGPLHGALVELYDLSGNYLGNSYDYTNSAGKFTIGDHLDPGTYYVEAYDFNNADGLAPGFSAVFTVAAGATATENVTLSAGGSVTGTVSGPTGNELTGSYVYVTAVNGSYSNWASVDSSGSYTLHGVPAGIYDVQWQAADSSYPYVWYDGSSLVSLQQDAQPITISNGQTATVNFSNIPAAGQITGTVTDAALNQPVAGAWAEVLDSRGNVVQYNETASDGSYSLSGLLPGSYKVEFVPQSGATVAGDPAPDLALQYYADASSFATASIVTVSAGQTTSGINAALSAGGTVSGRMTDAATGAGVPYATVELLTATGQEVDSAETNSDGSYTIYGVAPGSYFVEFASTWVGAAETVTQFYGGKSTLEGATVVTVGDGQAVTGINAAVGVLTAYAAPSESGAGMGGLNNRKVSFKVRVAEATAGGSPLLSMTVTLPKGLAFNAKKLAKRLKMGTGFAYSLSGKRVLHINLARLQSALNLTIKGGGITDTAKIAKLAKKHKIKSETVKVSVTDSLNVVTTFNVKIKRPK